MTNEQISKLCMYMRVIDLMKKNQKVLNENEELKKGYDNLCLNVNQIMETISDEQRDEVLELHKIQLQEIAKKEAKKLKVKKQRKKKIGNETPDQ